MDAGHKRVASVRNVTRRATARRERRQRMPRSHLDQKNDQKNDLGTAPHGGYSQLQLAGSDCQGSRRDAMKLRGMVVTLFVLEVPWPRP
jgi:hypothetical protein